MSEVSRKKEVEEIIQSNPYFPKSRLNSLYSNFENLKHLNPEGFEANIQAWSNLLTSLVQSGLLTDSQLSVNTFNPNIAQLLAIPMYGQPKGLGTVFIELVERRIFVPYSIYNNATDSFISLMDDSVKLTDYMSPKKWLHWGIHQLGLTSSFTSTNKKGELNKETYILWSILCTMGQNFINKIQEKIDTGTRSGSLFDNISLYKLMKTINPSLSLTDFEILLIHFSRDLRICKIKPIDQTICIIFLNQVDINNNFTEEDVGIIKLKSTITAIETRNEELETKVTNMSNDMKILLNNRNKMNEVETNIKLKNMLATRKVILDSLKKSSSALNQLTTTLLKINDATSNKNIYDLLSKSSKILNALNKYITLDDVDNLQIELEEGYERANEISESLASGATSHTNDEELENELNKLYEQESYSPMPATSDSNQTKDDLELIRKLENMKVNDDLAIKERKELEA